MKHTRVLAQLTAENALHNLLLVAANWCYAGPAKGRLAEKNHHVALGRARVATATDIVVAGLIKRMPEKHGEVACRV